MKAKISSIFSVLVALVVLGSLGGPSLSADGANVMKLPGPTGGITAVNPFTGEILLISYPHNPGDFVREKDGTLWFHASSNKSPTLLLAPDGSFSAAGEVQFIIADTVFFDPGTGLFFPDLEKFVFKAGGFFVDVDGNEFLLLVHVLARNGAFTKFDVKVIPM